MKNILIFLLAFALWSCNNTPPKEKTVFVNDTTHVQDTVIFIKDSTMAINFADSLPHGAYEGMFPCKGCPGIQHTILFDSNRTFRHEEQVWGTNALPKKSTGTWERRENKIWLMQNNKPVMKFNLRKDSLFTVEYTSVIKDSQQYILARKNLAAENATWKKQRAEGIDFVGTGNEPFWYLEIDNEKMVLFKLADWKKPIIVPIEKPVATKDSTLYTLTTDNAAWTVTVFPQFCSDGMSDYLYEQKVIIRFEGQIYKGCGVMLNVSR